jgi:hypothetical protein
MFPPLSGSPLYQFPAKSPNADERRGDQGRNHKPRERSEKGGGQSLNRDPDLTEIDHQDFASRERLMRAMVCTCGTQARQLSYPIRLPR